MVGRRERIMVLFRTTGKFTKIKNHSNLIFRRRSIFPNPSRLRCDLDGGQRARTKETTGVILSKAGVATFM